MPKSGIVVSRQEVADQLGRLSEAYGVGEFFLWRHVGYFPQDVEMAMLEEFAAAASMSGSYMQARGESVSLAVSDPARFQLLMGQIQDQMVLAESLGYASSARPSSTCRSRASRLPPTR